MSTNYVSPPADTTGGLSVKYTSDQLQWPYLVYDLEAANPGEFQGKPTMRERGGVRA